jgi:hypothetical protein
MKKTLLLISYYLLVIPHGAHTQTLPVSQNLPYSQNFGTTSFSSFPSGVQGWNGLNGGSISTQALAEASTPTGNATISALTATTTTTGALYGYCAGSTNCGNGRLYVQGSSNSTNGVNQFCVAIKMGIHSSLNISYTVEVVNIGSAASQGRVLQYRDSSLSSWSTVAGSAVVYTPGTSTNGGDADNAGDIDTFRYSLNGLTPNTTYYFRWAHWRTSGTSVGTAYDNISFSAGCTPPATQASAFNLISSSTTGVSCRITRGNGDSVLLLLKSGNAVNANPLAGVFYNSNSVFGGGTQIGTGNYVTAKTIDTAFSISNLTQNTTYFYALYEYRSLGFCYLNIPSTGSFTTPCANPTGQASFSSISPATVQATLQFNAGTGGSGRIVILNTSNSFTIPTDGFNPTANSSYNAGEQVVYSNTGNSVTVTNLLSNTKYYCRIYEFNCSGAQRKYNVTNVLDSFTTNLSTSMESDVIVVPGSEASVISTRINHVAPLTVSKGIQAWSFTIRDGGSDTLDIDTFPTIIQSIRLLQSAGNTANDWADAIESVALFKDTNLIATGVVSAAQILFSGNPLIAVGDNQAVNLTMRVSLQTSVNNSGTNTDNDNFGFSLSPANLILAPGSSQKDTTLGVLTSANNANKIEVVATKFKIIQQPVSTGKDAPMMSSVMVAAVDTFDNTDLDFLEPVLLTSSGAIKNNSMVDTAELGTAMFSNIIHNQVSDSVVLICTKINSASWKVISNVFRITKTTLFNNGDLVMIGYDNNVPVGDKLMLMNLVDILPGTKFCLINACYDLLNAANTRSNRWYDSDGLGSLTDSIYAHEITWGGSSKISIGSVLCISVPSIGTNYSFLINGVDSTNKFVVQDIGKGGSSPNMSTSSPDPIFIGQGNWTYYNTHAMFDGKILYGVMTGGVWYQFSDNVSTVPSSDRRSRIHPQTECLNLQGKTTSGNAFAYYNGIRNGTKKSILANITDPTKWVQGTGTSADNLLSPMPCTNSFSIGSKWADTNYWHGSANDNWFNCANWENYTVPDSSVNVVIKDTAANSVDIENFNTHAEKYGSVSICKNLTLDSNKTLIINDNFDTIKIFGNLHLKNGSILNLQTASGGIIQLRGNWTNESIADNIFEANSTLILFDTLTQVIKSNNPLGETIFNLHLNKAFQKSLILNSALNTNNLIFINGVIETKSNLLSAAGAISGYQQTNDSGNYNNNNYVIGKLKRTILSNGSYFFPIGDSVKGEGYNPVNLEILGGVGNATGEFIPGDPGDCNMPAPIVFNCGSSMNYMVKYDDMTGEGKWNFTGSTFSYNVKAFPNKLNLNTFPNDNTAPSYSATYRLLKSPSGTTDWTPYVLDGDSCSVSTNYYVLEGKGYSGFSQFAPGGGSGSSTALPVELIEFSGQLKEESRALLKWVTASERNNDYFAILRSIDGKIFEEVDRVNGQGNSIAKISYQQAIPLQQSSYFKLRQYDFDKTYTESKTIFIPLNMPKKMTHIFDGQKIKVVLNDLMELRLSSLSGANLMITTQNTLDISSLPSNIYLLTVVNMKGEIENIKIVK